MGSTVFERLSPSPAAVDASLAGSRRGVFWLEDAPAAIREQAVAFLEMSEAYRPRPYTGPMTYFLPMVRRFHVFADPMPVWRRVATGGLEVERVPGPHVGMVSGTGARVIARKIDEDLAP